MADIDDRRRRKAPGPLVVSPPNPRYFTVASDEDEQAVYLTGSTSGTTSTTGWGPG